MGLLDALLLDPYRMNVWIAVRTDGVPGSGTQNDPYDANGADDQSAAAKFDAVMNGLPSTPPIAVRLGPGTFKTNGYADGVTGQGWQPKPGMKIVGSGIDVTTLRLVQQAVANAHFYAIGHLLTSSGQPNLMDFFEVSDLTIDCNLAAYTGLTPACGAVRVMGNHARIRRLKVINWGTKATSRPCFVVVAVTADPPSGVNGVEDCGIEECIAISPDAGNQGPATVFHAGGIETAATNVAGYGVGPFTRNCFADAGESSPFGVEVRGLSMGWCKAGVIEGNQCHNMTYGTFHQATSARDVVVRNNWFKNVNKGVLLGGLAASQGSGSLTKTGTVATVTITGGHSLLVNDFVLLTTTGAFNGIVATVTDKTSTTFTFNTSIAATSDTVSSAQKVFGVTNVLAEGNIVELATATSGELIGIHLKDQAAAGVKQDATYPTYVFGTAIVRDNKVRYVDGQLASNYVGYGTQLNGAMDLLVRNNVVESASNIVHPVRNARCASVEYFNNQSPAGLLAQGWNDDTGNWYEELCTIADFALVMGLFNRRT